VEQVVEMAADLEQAAVEVAGIPPLQEELPPMDIPADPP
jgi:hypothetical protein